MSLNELIVEDAALECFGEQCRGAPTLTRPLPRLNPAIFFRTLATLRDNLLSGELSVAADSVIREFRITAADGPGQSAASRTRRKTAR